MFVNLLLSIEADFDYANAPALFVDVCMTCPEV